MSASASPRGTVRPDATIVLTTYVVVLMAIPAVLVVGPLGTAGAPATMLAVTAFFWWLWHHVHRAERDTTGRQPVRFMLVAALLAVLAAYAHAMAGPLPLDELSPADSGLIKMIGLVGVALVACDGISTLEHHRTVVRRVVLAVGAVALLGLVQKATGHLWIDRISIPGLSGGVDGWTLAERRGLARPSGTSTHPIEFGVVLTVVLPLAIVLAVHAPRHRLVFKLALAVTAFAAFLTLSRSAVLCAVVGLSVMALRWSWGARLRALGTMTLLTAAVYVTVPGVLGTLGNLFVDASEDASVRSRTAGFEIATTFVERSPLLGRGFGTFLPSYWILDNQYLLVLIETGVIGLAAFVGLFLTTAWSAWRAARLTLPEGGLGGGGRAADVDAEIAHALLASALAGATAFAFFDTLAFPQSAGLLFLVVGLCGSSLRLRRGVGRAPAPGLPDREVTWSR